MRTVLNRYLDTVGDGTGNKNANTNAATNFLIRPSANQVFVIEGLTVVVEDVGTLLASGYGALSALNTGISLVLSRPLSAPAEYDFLDGLLVKRHYDWARLPHKTAPVDSSLTGGTDANQFVCPIWFPEPVVLDGKTTQALIVRVPAENLTGLTGHYFKAHGYVAESR